MEHVAHSDWMFDHSLAHHLNTSADPHSATLTDTSQGTQTTPTDSAASVAKTLWHHTDSSSGSGTSAVQASSASSVTSNASNSSNANSSIASPTLTVPSALTVNAGGSVSLPIHVSPGNGQTSVTIAGLTNYETLTDSLDHQTFTPDANGSVTLSAAEVNSGLSLASNYTGSDHPVNTLTVTAAETVGQHTLTSDPQTITVTDPPASTSGSGSTSSGSNTLTLQVSGDQYNGDPQIDVFVDGHQMGGTYAVTADHASGQTQTITITGNFDPSVAHQVQVEFVNDASDGTAWWSSGGSADGHDRNVYVESISLNGQTLNGSQGTDSATNSIVPAANANEAVMDINGTLTFNVPDPPATSTSATGNSGTGSSTSSTSTSSSTTTSADTGSGSSSSAVGTGAADPAQATNAFYVSPNGSDSNPGTLAAPFATLAHAQQAMENSSTKTTYVEGGTYNLSNSLTLTSADNGETWEYYGPSGVDSAILDGGGTVNTGIAITSASNVTIDGLSLQNFVLHGVQVGVDGGATDPSNITIENNQISNISNPTEAATCAGVVVFDNSSNVLVSHNYIHDTWDEGISVYAYYAGNTTSNVTVTGNVVVRTVQDTKVADQGPIGTDMAGGSFSNIVISDNFVSDSGNGVAAGPAGQTGFAWGIYLDDNSSNVTITGNIIGPPGEGAGTAGSIAGEGGAAFIDHNGANDVFSGNIVDLGTTTTYAAGEWFSDDGHSMAGNTYTGNIVIADQSGAAGGYLETSLAIGSISISNNDYYNYGGGTVSSQGENFGAPTGDSDTSPLTVNPQISGYLYTIAQGSPVVQSPMDFQAITGGWGPAGLVVPQTSTPSA